MLTYLWCLLAHTRYEMYRYQGGRRVYGATPPYCPTCGCYR